MALITKLIGFGVRQVIGMVAGDEAAGPVIQLVERHFTDHSQTLPKALARANDRAWQALGIALAGDGFLDQIKLFFASGDDKGIREQVRLFVQARNIGYEGSPADFRKHCLAELKKARQAGLLSADKIGSGEVGQQAARFQRYADPKGLVEGAEQVMAQIADELAADFPHLGKLLRQRPAEGPPLLVAAFAYFFRREVETDDELAHGLFFDGLRQLSAAQAKAFGEVNKALTTLGDQFEQVFEQLARIETVVVETQAAVVATHGAVLDMQAEMNGLGDEVADKVARRLEQEVLKLVGQVGMQRGEVRPQHSFSIRSDDERNAVKQLLARFRQLPNEQQRDLPALLNGLGKLEVGAGDFEGATHIFAEVAGSVADPAAKAEAHHNAYRAALERHDWAAALEQLQHACRLDRGRFELFPLEKYEPERILGAGGFGVAFKCRHRFMNAHVVVKALLTDDLEQHMDKVFAEAQVLRQLDHPAIIRVADCGYMDVAARARPFLVMDYFDGPTLEEWVQSRGQLAPRDLVEIARTVAEGLQLAHANGILHRDVKPANVLVRNPGSRWEVRLIDFGLALRQETTRSTLDNLKSRGQTLIASSVAGTIDFAAPEQMGKLPGVPAGPYSDVYGFGKTCCYALFQTAQPLPKHFRGLPEPLSALLEDCLEEKPDHRPANFKAVLERLVALTEEPVYHRPEQPAARAQPVAETRQTEAERRQAEMRQAVAAALEEQERQRQLTQERQTQEEQRRAEEERRQAEMRRAEASAREDRERQRKAALKEQERQRKLAEDRRKKRLHYAVVSLLLGLIFLGVASAVFSAPGARSWSVWVFGFLPVVLFMATSLYLFLWPRDKPGEEPRTVRDNPARKYLWGGLAMLAILGAILPVTLSEYPDRLGWGEFCYLSVTLFLLLTGIRGLWSCLSRVDTESSRES